MSAWKNELQRTGDCIPIERLSQDLTPAEHSHLAHCVRCQSELTLWKAMNAEETEAEKAPVQAIASEVSKRLGTSTNVVSIASRRRFIRPASLAAAATIVVAIAAGVLTQNREPAIDSTSTAITAYRSASVEIVGPSGDLAAAPTALEWKAVRGATDYDVQVMEVDHTVLWHASTRELRIGLPSNVASQLVPGKTVLWQVRARRDQTIVGDSGVQRFRVRPAQ